ncbi:hypothetical protein [Salipiger sp. PrR003]|uniref:hypothetical protein n=1 Tax=Salipiger sp. PrR003 TaxID=2706776 RepID=UPI0013D96D1A|nr:hypothetical protein [Salipiger sp. PrR003]NDV50158.1 hypothetical protein [Salipiger sp. PrR003]
MAEQELETYEFAEYEFVDSSGWEFTSGSDRLEKPIFIKDPERADEDTQLGAFIVEFEAGSETVVSAEARLNGVEIGYRAPKGLSL